MQITNNELPAVLVPYIFNKISVTTKDFSNNKLVEKSCIKLKVNLTHSLFRFICNITISIEIAQKANDLFGVNFCKLLLTRL